VSVSLTLASFIIAFPTDLVYTYSGDQKFLKCLVIYGICMAMYVCARFRKYKES